MVNFALLVTMAVTVTLVSATATRGVQGRRKSGSDAFSKILANLAAPFVVQMILLPLVLVFMKLSVLKSMLIGKLGILIWIYNIVFNSSNPPGVLHSHSVNINRGEQAGYGAQWGN